MKKNTEKNTEDSRLTRAEKWSVYKHTSPSGKVYIGITHQKPDLRWRNGKGYDYNKHFYSAILHYGWENFTHEIVENGLTEEEAVQIEKRLVAEYKSTDRRYGYNIAEGGHILSAESRRKIGETRKARKIPSSTQGKHLSEETRRKISLSNKGNSCHTVWTEEQKEKVRQAKIGEKNPNYGKHFPERIKELSDLNAKPVIQFIGDKKVWHRSASDAEKATGIASCNISRVCRNKRQTAGGFVWKFAE